MKKVTDASAEKVAVDSPQNSTVIQPPDVASMATPSMQSGLLSEFSGKGVLLGASLMSLIVIYRWDTFAQIALLLWLGYAIPYGALWILRVVVKVQTSLKVMLGIALMSVGLGAIGSASLLLFLAPASLAGRMLAAAAVSMAFSVVLLTVALWTSLKLEVTTRLAVNRERALTNREALQKQIVLGKLQVLQAQVEPHFLYNTLANVQRLIPENPDRASALMEHLITYLRAALPKLRESTSTLAGELELVRAYLAVMKMRLGDRFAVVVDVKESLLTLPFPPLLLIPLVENSVKHGIELKPGPVLIRVAVDQQGQNICVVVSDNGMGFQAHSGDGVGLANVRERLKALFGSAASLDLNENSEGGVAAEIRITKAALWQLH